MKSGYLALAGAALLYAGAAQAQFINGGFEAGNANGWTVGGGDRAPVLNSGLNAADFLPGGSRYNATIANTHSNIITAGTTDPRVGAVLGTTVYSGQYSWRVEDTTSGGYASVLQQQVNNYTEANIFFAWKAVLEGAHGTNDAATMVIRLTDLTTNTVLINRQYNAASGGSGVDPRFTLQASTGLYYTAAWQIEQLTIDTSLSGHNFLLSILAADCEPTGHLGYVYLDGFGAVTPPPVDPGAVPEPATWAMMMLGFGMMGAMLRRRRTTVRFNTVPA